MSGRGVSSTARPRGSRASRSSSRQNWRALRVPPGDFDGDGAGDGRLRWKNLFCAQPESPLALDAIRGCESAEDLKALIARTLGRPKVRTSVEPGKEIPFVVVQEAQHFQVIPDQLVSLTFTTGPIERLIDRGR